MGRTPFADGPSADSCGSSRREGFAFSIPASSAGARSLLVPGTCDLTPRRTDASDSAAPCAWKGPHHSRTLNRLFSWSSWEWPHLRGKGCTTQLTFATGRCLSGDSDPRAGRRNDMSVAERGRDQRPDPGVRMSLWLKGNGGTLGSWCGWPRPWPRGRCEGL